MKKCFAVRSNGRAFGGLGFTYDMEPFRFALPGRSQFSENIFSFYFIQRPYISERCCLGFDITHYIFKV